MYPKYHYIPSSPIASFLDEYGSRSVPTAERLNELLFPDTNNDDVMSDVADDIDDMFPERFEDDKDHLSEPRSDDKLVGARANRFGFMFPIGYQRLIRNYAVRRRQFAGRCTFKSLRYK